MADVAAATAAPDAAPPEAATEQRKSLLDVIGEGFAGLFGAPPASEKAEVDDDRGPTPHEAACHGYFLRLRPHYLSAKDVAASIELLLLR